MQLLKFDLLYKMHKMLHKICRSNQEKNKDRLKNTSMASKSKENQIYHITLIPMHIWERIWEKGPIGNFLRHEIAEKLLFQMLQTIFKYS